MRSIRAPTATGWPLRAALLVSFLQLAGFSPPVLAQSAAPPAITLTASAREVAVNRTSRLSWTTTGAQRCVGSGPGWNQTYEGTAAARGTFTTPALTARTNEFSLSCTGAGGSSVQQVTVSVIPVPKVTLEASSDRALPGGSVQLTWRSDDATSCTASGAPFTGTKPTSGTERLSDLTKGTKTFKLTCRGVGGSGSADVKVTVIAKPTLTFSASKTQIAENTGTQLKWKATDATSCLASGDWSGSQNTSGSFNTGNLSSDKTYTLTCSGLNGEVEQTVKVEVVAAPIVRLSISNEIVAPGESVTLNWSVEDAQSCSASGSPFTGSKNPAGDSETLSNLTKGAKTFKLTCKGGGGTTAAEAKLTVIAPPTLTFSASKTQLAENTGTQLKWKASDATSCLASGDWSGPQNTSGSFDTGNLTSDKTYTLSCTGLNGEVEQTVKVEVVAAPRVTLTVSDDLVAPGESVRITWNVEDAQSCSASGSPFTGSKNPAGDSETLSNLTKGAKTFKLTCRGAGGTTAAEAKLTVIAPPTLTFSASKTQIAENAGTQLRWRSTDATSCLASGDWSGPQNTSDSFDTGNLTSDKTYTLTCTGLNGEVEQTVKVEVIPAPTVSLSLSDTLVEPGTAVTLSWDSEYAQSCTASGGGWSGSRTLSGTETVTFATPGKRVFTLTCRGVGGPKAATVELGVFPKPKILSFTADPALVQAGQTTTLKWQTKDTSACTASGDWSGPQARNSTGAPSPVLTKRNNVLTLTCRGDGGETSESVTVEAQGAPEVSLSIDRTLITSGEKATLTWTSAEATSCTASGAWSGTKTLSGTEASTALEPGNYTFTLRCVNAVGSDTKSVSVESAKPQAAIDLTTLAFGDTGVGVTPRRSVKVTNTGKVALTVLSATLGGTNADQFVLTSSCGVTLAPTAECSVEVTFRPTSGGAKSANLEIKGAGANPLAIALTGTAAFQTLTVSKSGEGNGTVISVPAGIDCGNTCSANFNIGTSVTLTASAANDSTFTGWSGACTGIEPCKLSVAASRVISANFRRNITGKVSKTTISFGSVLIGESEESSTTVQASTEGLRVLGATLSGQDPDSFAIVTNCSSFLGSNEGCAISVIFKPTSFGDKKAKLTIESNADSALPEIDLTGAGAGASLNGPKDFDAGSQSLGILGAERSVDFTNAGSLEALVTNVSISGRNADEFEYTRGCSNMPVGTSCGYRFRMSGRQIGEKRATLIVRGKDSGGERERILATVELRGVVTEQLLPQLSFAESEVDFGQGFVGDVTEYKRIKITNSGDVPANLRVPAYDYSKIAETENFEAVASEFLVKVPLQKWEVAFPKAVDVNGDGKLDLIIHFWSDPADCSRPVGNVTSPNVLRIYIWNEGFVFKDETSKYLIGSDDLGGRSRKAEVADLNGDGKLDIAYAVNQEDCRFQNTPSDMNGQMAALLSVGDSYKIVKYGVPSWYHSLAIGVDEDGRAFVTGSGYTAVNRQKFFFSKSGEVTSADIGNVQISPNAFDFLPAQSQSNPVSRFLIQASNEGLDFLRVQGFSLESPAAWRRLNDVSLGSKSGSVRVTYPGGIESNNPVFDLDRVFVSNAGISERCVFRMSPEGGPLVLVSAGGGIIRTNGTNEPYVPEKHDINDWEGLRSGFGLWKGARVTSGRLRSVPVPIINEQATVPGWPDCRDVNGDGYQDLVSYPNDDIAVPIVYLNDREGSLRYIGRQAFPRVPVAWLRGGESFLADFDTDGVQDLVVFPGQMDSHAGSVRLPVYRGIKPLTAGEPIHGISIVGAGAASFRQLNNCTKELSPGDSCYVSITFSPQRSGSTTAQLVVNQIGRSISQPVTLRGAGVDGVARVNVSAEGDGTGAITSDLGGIDCGVKCHGFVSASSIVTLTATPEPDSTFSGWTGDCAGEGECRVKVDDGVVVSANFWKKRFPLQVARSGNGSGVIITSNGGPECSDGCTNAYKIGTTVTLTATAAEGSIFTGWSGACSGLGSCTVTMSEAKSVVAMFAPKPAAGVISGRWTGTDLSRPAYISVSSAADDSFLKVVTVASDGSFEISGLDPSKEYLLEPEQSGTKVVSSQAFASAAMADERMFLSAAVSGGNETSALARAARPGDYINFLGEKIPGLTENEFVYRWEGNPSVSGAEYSSYIVNPINVEIVGKAESPSDDQAAIRLAESFGIVLVNPGSPSASAGAMVWTNEYADRFLKLASSLGFPAYVDPSTRKPRENFPPTYVTLTNRVLLEDLERVGSSYLGDKFTISEAAFANATPSLARVEGKRGVFYSNRLFRALVRVVTNGGTDVTKLAQLMKDRYGITVSSDSSTPMPLPSPPSTCPQYPSDCQQAEWRLFKADELLDLVSILEEYPTPLLNISFPEKQRGMRYFLRRRDGVFHPKYKPSDAVAWIPASYAEFMEKGFGGVQLDGVARERARQQRYQLIVHEKAHFVWSNLLDDKTRLDWSKLSGWWKSPVKPGEDPKVVGKCDEWTKDQVAWSPPNTTAQDLLFDGSFGHDENISDADELRSSWGSCSTAQFVTAYAAMNPNEDFADSFASFLVNPELLRTRALPKYEFIRDRLMQGSIYLSRIRDDLTFQVLNLYPDYVYPGKIKSLEVRLTGGANQDKQGTVRITLHTSTCAASKNSGCFEGASVSFMNIESKMFPDGSKQDMPIALRPVNGNGAVLEGSFSLSKFAAAGWWKNPQITLRDAVGNERQLKATSADFGWRLYVNSPLEDLEAPTYLKNSVRFRVLEPGDPLISKGVTGDARELMVTWRLNEPNIPNTNGHCQATLVSNSARPSFGMVGNSRTLSNQADGATMECVARWIVTRFFPTDRYFISALYTDDLAGNRREIRLSPKGEDPTLERSPEVAVSTSASDTVAPTLDITPCKASEIDERCLRIVARPTNPSSPNGETIVDLYYWAYEELPVSTASGLGRVDFTLRDPLGKTFSYPAECRDWYSGNAFGVPGKCPIDSWLGSPITADSSPYTNVYFLCPDGTASLPERTSSSRADCTAVTPVQYHAQVVLPVGSAPGTWGLLNMSVRDKVRNTRGYDFTELFRFDPTSSASGRVIGASEKSTASSPFTFTVGEAATEETADIAATSAAKTISLNLVGSKPSDTRVADSTGASPSRSGSGGGMASSSEKDPLTGSEYRIVHDVSELGADPQRWWLEYRANNDELLGKADLPETSRVIWRRATEEVDTLATGGHVVLCSDQVWTVQDGYRLITHRFDKSLTAANQNEIEIARPAEVSLVTDVGCGTSGSLTVSGFVFGVSDTEPPLSAEPVPAHRFEMELNRSGEVARKTLTPTEFVLPAVCASPKNELIQFCTEAKRAVGW